MPQRKKEKERKREQGLGRNRDLVEGANRERTMVRERMKASTLGR
jgi:hypothetical protein